MVQQSTFCIILVGLIVIATDRVVVALPTGIEVHDVLRPNKREFQQESCEAVCDVDVPCGRLLGVV